MSCVNIPEYTILQKALTAQDYHDLRFIANLTPPPMEAVPKSLSNSFVCFTAFQTSMMEDHTMPSTGQHPIAMGRLVGDGALFLQLIDVAVDPDHQGKGLGKQIMQRLVDYADKYAPHAYVSLVADALGQRLYPKFGFQGMEPSVGMYRCKRIQENREFKRTREERNAMLLKGATSEPSSVGLGNGTS